jgi:Concanavalin A-like lectin/glucanases superfamily
LYLLQANNGGVMELNFATQGANDNMSLISSTKLTTGNWYHIVAAYYDGMVTLYVNGIQSGSSVPMPDFLWGDTTTNYIGKSENTSDPYLTAVVDEFKIYNLFEDPSAMST